MREIRYLGGWAYTPTSDKSLNVETTVMGGDICTDNWEGRRNRVVFRTWQREIMVTRCSHDRVQYDHRAGNYDRASPVAAIFYQSLIFNTGRHATKARC